ncbi:unnamed protein product [Rhodiola kirilowii]
MSRLIQQVGRVFPVRPSLFRRHHGRYTFPLSGQQDLLTKPSLNGCRVFCTSQDLTIKKCVPCNSRDMQAMAEEAANELITKVPGWNLEKDGGTLKLNRSWKVKSFTKGLEFFQAVAEVAETEGHHPDLHLVGWNNVKIDIWTHAVGGLTENDFILAAKINMLDLQHLLRRKVAAV